jgi:two-component sensor histidine kinase
MIDGIPLTEMRHTHMTDTDEETETVDALLAAPDLADALESEPFRRFLDRVPIAIVVAEVKGGERIAYANPEFESLSGQPVSEVKGQAWSALHGHGKDGRQLGAAVIDSSDCVGTFEIICAGRDPALVDVYSNLIEDDDGAPSFRLVALLDVGAQGEARREDFEQRIRDKDTLLLELQHRVKNNLQMITALIRIETRKAKGRIDTAPFDRLAGRIDSLAIVYKLMSAHGPEGGEIDLGVYLSEIVSAVMHAHAVEGIRLNLKVDAYPVSVNVAIPAGLVVNELLTNALKHAFVGRDGGTITLHSLVNDHGCSVVVADDGIGLPEGVSWPRPGKLSALIVQSLRDNAKANLKVESGPGRGTCVTISFKRSPLLSAPPITAAAIRAADPLPG